MSVHIALDNAPEFYTNLDYVTGRVILSLNRTEQIGGIVVKLEGESSTALTIPITAPPGTYISSNSGPGEVLSESHKILYKVQQVHPEQNAASSSMIAAYALQPGQHQFPFEFKLPLNNICGNPEHMSKLGGMAGLGGFGSSGVRVMDGSRQLMYRHVLRTLPPSLTGFPREAEIRYYIKATIQRPGLFKENWRFQKGLKFLPVEPPRLNPTNQETFAQRPFTWRPRSPVPNPKPELKQRSFFGGKGKDATAGSSNGVNLIPPSVEISARLPHPTVLTCNEPAPLRLVAKKLAPSPEPVFLTSMEINLIGKTRVRSHDLTNVEVSRWVIFSQSGLSIPVTGEPSDPVGTETTVSDAPWSTVPLPNTVTPSFLTCNLQRSYEVELKLGLTWGDTSLPGAKGNRGSIMNGMLGKNKSTSISIFPPLSVFLPLHFSKVDIFSGIKPPAALLDAAITSNTQQLQRQQQHNVLVNGEGGDRPPPLPARPPPALYTQSAPVISQQQQQQQQNVAADPLFPPQLGTPQAASYEDAPPSYDEAVADSITGPESRPAYSGQTNENAPSLIKDQMK